MQVLYRLEVRGAGEREPLASFVAPQPFMAVQRGDVVDLHPRDSPAIRGAFLRVIGVRHLLVQQGERLEHTVGVFTRAEEIEPALVVPRSRGRRAR